jgi:hypothetical protein
MWFQVLESSDISKCIIKVEMELVKLLRPHWFEGHKLTERGQGPCDGASPAVPLLLCPVEAAGVGKDGVQAGECEVTLSSAPVPPRRLKVHRRNGPTAYAPPRSMGDPRLGVVRHRRTSVDPCGGSFTAINVGRGGENRRGPRDRCHRSADRRNVSTFYK